MDLYLKGKAALVTGAGSGIGRTTALLLAEEGVRVCCSDLFEDKAAETANMIGERGGTAIGSVCDVTDYERVKETVAQAVDNFGRLDILINSAGLAMGNLFAETDPQDWSREIDVNLVGTMHCCHAAIEHMIPKRYGKILTIASDAGRVGEKRMSVYGAAKGGVIAFSKCLALEMARFKIHVNAVCPGVVNSPMTSWLTEEMQQEWAKHYPLRRLGEPEDIANMLVFLCSDRTSWMTGQTISVDGGFSRI